MSSLHPKYGAEPSAVEFLSALAQVAGTLSPAQLSVETGRDVLRRGVVAFGAAGGVACIVDARGERLDIVELGVTASVPATVAEIIASGEEAWFATADAIAARCSSSVTDHVSAIASVHVGAGAQCTGGLAFWFDGERAFLDLERSFLRMLGWILAQEVDRSSLVKQQRTAIHDREKMARWAEVLGDAFRVVSSSASLTQIIDELSRVSCETPADFSAIRVLSADRRMLEFRGLHHRDPVQRDILRAVLGDRPIPADMGATGDVLATGKSFLWPVVDMPKLLRTYTGTSFGEYIARFPVSSVMVVPLASRGAVFGVVSVARTGPEPFQEIDLRFLEQVADRAAAALDTANLLQNLARSEEQLRVALEAGRLGAWDWDIPGGKVTWSAMLEEIHGLEAGGFEGTFDAYQYDIHPEDRDNVLATIRRAVEQRTDHHIVYRINRPDGETRWLEASGRLLCDSAGAPQRLVGVCLDVTDRRNADDQLRHTLLALRDADHRKDQFLAMLAHELRNPLGPMLNATHLLRVTGAREDSAMRWVEILDRQVQHMARLLDDLLDVSRITRGKIELVREPIDVCTLIREVVGDHRESFRAAALALELSAPGGPLFVHADRTRLAQIVGNLLSNALKFSHRGQVVRMGVERDPSCETVVLTVRDQGAGIEPAFLARMFEPFAQADTSLSRPRGGLGLGLAVVEGLVALHGGRVSASSAGLGHGAELRVELPLHVGPDQRFESAAPGPSLPQDRSPAVLIFEDNADAAESLRMLLSASGYRVRVEETGRQAMEVVRMFHPTVILCDLGLPDRDGYSIAAEIRSDRELAHLPLIAISGYGSAEDQARARRAGFDLHLTKPVPPALLLAELSRRIAQAG